jgi:tetratricopeptide (TPR) repeat protein
MMTAGWKNQKHAAKQLNTFKEKMKNKFIKNKITTAINEVMKNISATNINNPRASSKTSEVSSTNQDHLIIEPDVHEFNQLDIQLAREHIADCVIKGRLTADVLNGIQTTLGFMPVEGSLLDYKRDAPANAYEIAKVIRHIVAFHNMYGGYLIFGVDEVESDKLLIPVDNILNKNIDSKQIRDLCRQYTGSAIEIQTATIDVTHAKCKWVVQLLHIPMRSLEMPVSFKKRGPENNKGTPIFDRDDVVLRYGDNSIKAQLTEHWRLLISNRNIPFAKTNKNHNNKIPIWNTLPDRHLIFSTFIGRDYYISKLYEWFADDFSCVKVLAGAGGLGKTSVAYQFASEICTNHLVDFTAVYWMTAKLLQFRPMTDRYEKIAVTHFSSARELFSEIARNLAALDDEIDATSDAQFPRFLRDLLKEHHMFFICDDIDSLSIDDQKRVVEVFQQLGGLGSRFLLTTRKNTTASTVTAIELKGLTIDEYPKLVAYWLEHLTLPDITSKELIRLHEASLGSPLYTESIFRLIKSGYTISDSIAKWKGALGEEVRNAALQREVGQLGNEAKKILVTIAILGDCSLAELRIASGFSDLTLIDATNELQSLFLITPPTIAGEPRFSIPSTTRMLVSTLGPELVPAFIAYRDNLLSQKFKPKGATEKQQYVGAAIDQANAMLIGKRPEEALNTAEEANRQLGGQNSDLVFMCARALTYHRPPRYYEASKRFNTAFNLGQRKYLFFSLWFETEMAIEHFESAVEVAGRALEASSGDRNFWLKRRAEARLQVAALHSKAENHDAAIVQLKHAAEDLAACPDKKGDLSFRQEWESLLFNTHNALINLQVRSRMDVHALLSLIDDITQFPRRGDVRLEIYIRAENIFSQLKSIMFSSQDGYTKQQFNLIATQARRCKIMFNEAPTNLSNFSAFRISREKIFSFSDA